MTATSKSLMTGQEPQNAGDGNIEVEINYDLEASNREKIAEMELLEEGNKSKSDDLKRVQEDVEIKAEEAEEEEESEEEAEEESEEEAEEESEGKDIKQDLKKSQEDVEIMRAKAGYALVDIIVGEDSRPVKILYMTNKQAVHVANNSDAMRKMESALFGENLRYLIIDLVQSWGFYNSTKIMSKDNFDNTHKNTWNAGIEFETAPFKILKEEHETINRINHFMTNVIIPLAEKTSAIVVCNAVVQDCILAECFTNMVESMSSRWGGEPPFAIVGILGCVDVLYNNKKKDATWRTIRKKSSAWKNRHGGVLLKHFNKPKTNTKDYHHDLCWTTSKLVIIEGLDIHQKSGYIKKNRAPFSLFMTSFMRHFGVNAPQLAFKTGACTRDDHVQKKHYRGIQDMSYRNLLDRVHAGTNVVCLDVRKRDKEEIFTDDIVNQLKPPPASGPAPAEDQVAHGSNRSIVAKYLVKSTNDKKKISLQNKQEILEKLLTTIKERFHDPPKENGPLKEETLDCCMLAYLDELLADWKTLKKDSKVEDRLNRLLKALKGTLTHKQKNRAQITTLKEAIDHITTDQKEKHGKNGAEIDIKFFDFANTFAWEFYKNLPLPPDSVDRRHGEEEARRHHFSSRIQTTASFAMQLLVSSHFQGMNIWDRSIEQVESIDKIVLKSFETEDSLEGLKLLKKAWDEVDKTRDLATYYGRISDYLYQIQLTLGLLLTFFSVMVGYDFLPEWNIVILWLSLALGVVASIETILSPRSYWYQLRTAQVKLESLIWRYRTRVGEFEVDRTNSNQYRPEQNLRFALEIWGQELVTGSKNTSATGIHGKWRKLRLHKILGRLAKKRVVSCKETFDNGDDNFSYVDGKNYVKWRVEPLKEQYQSKIPNGLFFQYKYDIIIVLLGAAIAIISEQLPKIDAKLAAEWSSALVAMLTAVVAFLTSWIEFRGTTKEANMLSSAIQECNNQVYRWTELTKFMAQSRKITNELVEEVERIVIQVMTSWSTSILKKSETSTDHINSIIDKHGQKDLFPLRHIREQLPEGLADQYMRN